MINNGHVYKKKKTRVGHGDDIKYVRYFRLLRRILYLQPYTQVHSSFGVNCSNINVIIYSTHTNTRTARVNP